MLRRVALAGGAGWREASAGVRALTRVEDFLAITCSRSSSFIEEIRQSGCVIVR